MSCSTSLFAAILGTVTFFIAKGRVLPSATLETLQSLDTDGSGLVEQNEIESFARSQGLDVQKAIADFQELDEDRSGDLDLNELGGSLDRAEAPAASPPLAPLTEPNMTSLLSVETLPPFQVAAASSAPEGAVPTAHSPVAASSKAPAGPALGDPPPSSAAGAQGKLDASAPDAVDRRDQDARQAETEALTALASLGVNSTQQQPLSQQPIDWLQEQEPLLQEPIRQAMPSPEFLSSQQLEQQMQQPELSQQSFLKQEQQQQQQAQPIVPAARAEFFTTAATLLPSQPEKQINDIFQFARGDAPIHQQQSLSPFAMESAAAQTQISPSQQIEQPPFAAAAPLLRDVNLAADTEGFANDEALPTLPLSDSDEQLQEQILSSLPLSVDPEQGEEQDWELAKEAPPPPAVRKVKASTNPTAAIGTITTAAIPALGQMRTQNASAWLEMSVDRAERLAAKATAEAFARQAEEVFAQEKKDEHDALAFETLAKKLRANASALVDTVAVQTQHAANEAITSVMRESMLQVKKMEEQAARAEEEAASRREKAATAMSQALAAKQTVLQAVRRLRSRHRE